MSGGYVSCGSWLGDDKSCSAFLPLLDSLEEVVAESERAEWETKVVAPLRTQLDATDADDMPFLRLNPDTMECLGRVARRYVEQQIGRGVAPEPDESFSADGWRSGPGWRLYCATDLVTASEKAQSSGNEVVIHFD